MILNKINTEKKDRVKLRRDTVQRLLTSPRTSLIHLAKNVQLNIDMLPNRKAFGLRFDGKDLYQDQSGRHSARVPGLPFSDPGLPRAKHVVHHKSLGSG